MIRNGQNWLTSPNRTTIHCILYTSYTGPKVKQQRHLKKKKEKQFCKQLRKTRSNLIIIWKRLSFRLKQIDLNHIEELLCILCIFLCLAVFSLSPFILLVVMACVDSIQNKAFELRVPNCACTCIKLKLTNHVCRLLCIQRWICLKFNSLDCMHMCALSRTYFLFFM